MFPINSNCLHLTWIQLVAIKSVSNSGSGWNHLSAGIKILNRIWKEHFCWKECSMIYPKLYAYSLHWTLFKPVLEQVIITKIGEKTTTVIYFRSKSKGTVTFISQSEDNTRNIDLAGNKTQAEPYFEYQSLIHISSFREHALGPNKEKSHSAKCSYFAQTSHTELLWNELLKSNTWPIIDAHTSPRSG